MTEPDQPRAIHPCGCVTASPGHLKTAQELGLDSQFAEVSVCVCQDCGQLWLRYFYEVEAFTGSARWYLGAITQQQLATLRLESAKGILEDLDEYYYGGSYYQGQQGKTSGKILLLP
ncbi:MAG: hypothetical protein WCA35_05155 [Kovacikia sp.]